MNKEQAARLVDKWAKDWRTYLDGQLHRGPRHALIEAIVAATSQSDDDASEDLEGKPMTDAGIKAVMRDVNEADEAQRRAARAITGIGDIDELVKPLAHAPGVVSDTAEADAPPVTTLPGEPDKLAAADALKLLRDAAREDKRPLLLTPSQIARFNGFGMLEGVDYVVAEPSPLLTETKPVEVPRNRHERRRRR